MVDAVLQARFRPFGLFPPYSTVAQIENLDSVQDGRGKILLCTQSETRTILQEQFATAVFTYNSNTAMNATNTVYTVPAGKIFLLISATLQNSYMASTAGNTAELTLNSALLFRLYGGLVAGNIIQEQAFPVLIPAFPGDTFKVISSSNNVFAAANVFGYEINITEYYPIVPVNS